LSRLTRIYVKISEMSDEISIHEAYKRGDLDALKRLIGDPPDFQTVAVP